jgi:hypothetical protein
VSGASTDADIRAKPALGMFSTWTCPDPAPCRTMLSMPAARTTRQPVRRVVLVPATPTSSRGRGDEPVRRYRLARLRLEGREATAAEAPPHGHFGG